MKSPFKQILCKFGVRQKRLANLSGVSQGHISEVCSGMAELGPKLEAFLRGIPAIDVDNLVSLHNKFMIERREEVLRELEIEESD